LVQKYNSYSLNTVPVWLFIRLILCVNNLI
jgi:hypothetical protein